MKPFIRIKWWLVPLMFLVLFVGAVRAVPPVGGDTNFFINAWSFLDTTNWTSDYGTPAVSFTNLSSSNLGDGTALVLDSTNAAWLKYPVYDQSLGTNVLTVDVGSVSFWMAPASWASTNGALGGQYGRMIEVGAYTTNASYGWWCLFTDGTNIFFSAQTNGAGATYLSTPISWTTNEWHMVTLTYSSSNCSLYIDAALVTNAPALTYWPGPNVQTNGFTIGSDAATGLLQAHCMFDDITTYSYPLDQSAIQNTYDGTVVIFRLNPDNWINLTSAPFTNTANPIFNIVTGSGYITQGGTNAVDCVLSTNIWITNFVAKLGTNSTMNLSFMIRGGADGVLYDVFANSILALSSDTNHPWSWMGQAYHCVTNSLSITNLPNVAAFLILGQPTDQDGDGLTDAFELLVSKTSPTNAFSAGDGIPDAWKVLNRLNPQTSGLANLDPDLDALSNKQEYLYGTKPQVSEGFSIWLSTPSGFNGIP